MREIIKEWALSLPRSYQGIITPDKFMSESNIKYDYTQVNYAFLDLCDEGFFKIVHMVKCLSCGHILFTGDNVNDVLRTIFDYSVEQWDCDFCEKNKELTIDHCYKISTNIK